MARASQAKKKYSHKVCTENANVGSVSCHRHRAYITSNEPAVEPNKIRSRATKGYSCCHITSSPIRSPMVTNPPKRPGGRAEKDPVTSHQRITQSPHHKQSDQKPKIYRQD